MILLSIVGLFKTLLIIIGVFVLMRFIGQVMTAKRNIDEQERSRKNTRDAEEEIREAKRNFGRTSITSTGKKKFKDEDFADYEEVD